MISEGESSDNDEAMLNQETISSSDTESDVLVFIGVYSDGAESRNNFDQVEKSGSRGVYSDGSEPKREEQSAKEQEPRAQLKSSWQSIRDIQSFKFTRIKRKTSSKYVDKVTEEATQQRLTKKRGRPRKRANVAA